MSDPTLPMLKKRVTFKKTRENHNIKILLKELYSRIVEKDHATAQKIEQALVSLSKYPLQITSGEGCYILQGFDKNLCRFVDEQLFNKNLGASPAKDTMPKSPLSKYFETFVEEPNTLEEMNFKVATNDINEYKRGKNTNINHEVKSLIDGILLTLHQQEQENPDKPALDVKDLMSKIQIYWPVYPVTESKFLKILLTSRKYIKSNLKNGDTQYSLTYLGKDVVSHLIGLSVNSMFSDQNVLNQHTENDRVPVYQNQLSPAPTSSSTNDDSLIYIDMPAGTYDIIMLVDKNEPEMLAENCSKNVKSESRSLKVGDVIWVARSHFNSQELVLPYVVERKRMDDFAASIKDGRFHEQKFRLRKCRLKNVIYLLEDHQGNKHCGLSMATLNQARANTRVQESFMIHQTNSLRGTKRFLNQMTMRLSRELKDHDVHLRGVKTEPIGREYMTFEYFNALSAKTKPLTVKELFIKMLLQLKGISVEKALAITKVYNSPMALMNAYDGCDKRNAELLLADLKFNEVTPRVTPALSKLVYMLFTIDASGQLL